MAFVNHEAEAAFIGSFFLDETLVHECTVKPAQLYSKRLKRLLEIFLQLAEKGKPIDIISIVEEIGAENIESVGDISYISELACSVPSTANFSFYQDTVKAYDRKRKAASIAARLQKEIVDGDIEKTVQNGIQALMQLADYTDDADDGDIKSTLIELYHDCEQDLGEITGIASGFSKLDSLTGGFQPSDLIVIGARPSVGKTAFALNICLNAVEKDIVLLFSLEMSKKQMVKRAVGLHGNVQSIKLRNPRRFFGKQDWENYSSSIGCMSGKNFEVFDKAGMDIHYIRSMVRKVRRARGEEKRILVIIDYLQLIASTQKQQNRQAEISEISRELKHLARDLNVCVIALSQLSRGVENRQDKHPMLSDLCESGQIEQDADVIAFLYRDDYYYADTEKKNVMEVIVAKQRNGPIGTIELSFQKETGCFLDR